MQAHNSFLRYINVCAIILVSIGSNATWAGDIDFGKDINEEEKVEQDL